MGAVAPIDRPAKRRIVARIGGAERQRPFGADLDGRGAAERQRRRDVGYRDFVGMIGGEAV